jgi:hypothetical protein
MSDWMVMNNELKRMWKEHLWPNLRHYPGILWRDGKTLWKCSLENLKGYERTVDCIIEHKLQEL